MGQTLCSYAHTRARLKWITSDWTNCRSEGLPSQPTRVLTNGLPSQSPVHCAKSCSGGLLFESSRRSADSCSVGLPSQLPRSCTEDLPCQSPIIGQAIAPDRVFPYQDQHGAVRWSGSAQYCTWRCGHAHALARVLDAFCSSAWYENPARAGSIRPILARLNVCIYDCATRFHTISRP